MQQIVHPVQEDVVMSGHTYRIFEFETNTEDEAQAFAKKAAQKGWQTWVLGYTAITHAQAPVLPHGGVMFKLVEAPTGADGQPCRCPRCL